MRHWLEQEFGGVIRVVDQNVQSIFSAYNLKAMTKIEEQNVAVGVAVEPRQDYVVELAKFIISRSQVGIR